MAPVLHHTCSEACHFESQIHKQLKFVVVLWGEPSGSVHGLDCPVLSFNDLLAKAGNRSVKPVSIRGNDLATLVFTSGTTGAPKVTPPPTSHHLGGNIGEAGLANMIIRTNIGLYPKPNPTPQPHWLVLPPVLRSTHFKQPCCGPHWYRCGLFACGYRIALPWGLGSL